MDAVPQGPSGQIVRQRSARNTSKPLTPRRHCADAQRKCTAIRSEQVRTRPQSSHVPPASRSRPATSLHDVKLSFRKGLHTGQQRIPPSLGTFSSLPLKSLPQARHHGIGIFLPGPAASPLAGPFRCPFNGRSSKRTPCRKNLYIRGMLDLHEHPDLARTGKPHKQLK